MNSNSKSLYLATTKEDGWPMFITPISRDGMMGRLSSDNYKYRLVLPCEEGKTLDIYLRDLDLCNGLYEPLKDIKMCSDIESIVTNNVTKVERGYYRYSKLLHLSPYGRMPYQLTLKLSYDEDDYYIIIKPKFYHKYFFIKYKSKLKPLTIYIDKLYLNRTLNILQRLLF